MEVGRVAGADPAQVAQRVAALAQALGAPTNAAPAPAKGAPAATAAPLAPETIARLKGLVTSARCVAFIKGTPAEPRCGFTRQLVQLLAKHNVDYVSYNILADDEARQGPLIARPRALGVFRTAGGRGWLTAACALAVEFGVSVVAIGLKVLFDWPTFPQVYVDGDLVGGLDILKEMEASGELAQVVPIKAPSAVPAVDGIGAASLEDRLRVLVRKAPVMVFMKGTPDAPQCGFSSRLVALLRELGAPFQSFDILADEQVRQGLKVFSNWPTFPQLYVNGELVGGIDIAQELKATGELQELLATAVAPAPVS